MGRPQGKIGDRARLDAVEVAVLGPLEVRSGGRPQPLPASRKTRALLGYLAVESREHRRERLCDLLWDAPDDPRGALRWSLSRLRALFASDDPADVGPLIADREKVAFAAGGRVGLDLALVRARIGAQPSSTPTEALRQAARAFRGDLLEGLELAGAPRFHSWLVSARAATRRLQAAVLATLGERSEVPAEDAVCYARDLVGLDPLDQPAQVRLLRLLARLGRVVEAREQHEVCLRVLHEAGLRPSAELVAAHLAIAGHRAPVGTALESPVLAGPPTAAGPAPASRFVGRAPELDRGARALRAAAAGRSPGLLTVSGDPGQGKTRFLAELAALARAAGGLVLQGRAFAAEMIRPYGAWIDAIRSAPVEEATPEWRRALAALVPDLAPDAAPAGAGRGHLFDAVVQALCGAAERHPGPLLVVLDDLQWFDEASAALAHYVAREPRGGRVLIAAGVRPGEVADNPPVRRLLRGLRAAARTEDVSLPLLDAAAVTDMVRDVDDAVDADRVFRESGGNPLFVIEVAGALARGGAALSPRLEDLIGERLDRISPAGADLLPWAAALGRGFSSDLLAHAVGRPDVEVAAALEELERANILRAVGDELDFTHDLLREVAERRLLPGRRQAVHRHLGRVLEAQPDPDGTLASDVALHAALGGDLERAARACVRAGDRCLRLFAHREAAALADRGTAYCEPLPPQVALPVRVELMRLRVHPGLKADHLAQIAASLRGLSDELAAFGMTDQVLACFRLLVRLEFYGGQLDAVRRDSLEAASASRGGDPAAAARTLGAAAVCLAWLEKEMPRARAMLTEAERLSREAGLDLSDVPLGLGLVRIHEGETEEGLRLLERAHRLAMAGPDYWNAFAAVLSLVLLHLDEARPEDAWRKCRELEVLSARFAEGSERPVVAALEALCALEAGDAAAGARIDGAVAALRTHDHSRMLAYVLTALARRALREGDPQRAQRLAAEALENADRLGRRSELLMARLTIARAEHARGDREAAQRHLDWMTADLSRPDGASAAVRAAAASTMATLRGGVQRSKRIS